MNNNADNFYNGYTTEEKNGEEILFVERKADKVAEEIEKLEADLEEDFNRGDVKRLETLNKYLDELEAQIELLKYGNAN